MCVFAPEDDAVIGAHMKDNRCDEEWFDQFHCCFIVLRKYISRRQYSVVLNMKQVRESFFANAGMFGKPQQMFHHCLQ